MRHPSAVLANLFLRAYVMSLIQSGGVYFAAQLHPLGLVTAFLISRQWIVNSRAAVDCRPRWSREAYGVGGMAGYATTMALVGCWRWWRK